MQTVYADLQTHLPYVRTSQPYFSEPLRTNHADSNGTKVTKQYLSIDSSHRDRTSYPNPNNYRVFLQTPLKNIVSCSLLHAQLPNSIYNVTLNNNRFKYSELRASQAVYQFYLSSDTGHIGVYRFSDLPVTDLDVPQTLSSEPEEVHQSLEIVRGFTYVFYVPVQTVEVKFAYPDPTGGSLGMIEYTGVNSTTIVHNGQEWEKITWSVPTGSTLPTGLQYIKRNTLDGGAIVIRDYTTEFSIPPGHYNPQSLIDKVSRLLETTSPTNSNYELKFFLDTHRFAFFNSAIDVTQFSIYFSEDTFYEVLGFPLGTFLKNGPLPPGFDPRDTEYNRGDIVSPRYASLNQDMSYVLASEQLQSNHLESTTSRAFAIVPVNTALGQVIFFNRESQYAVHATYNPPIAELQYFDIRWINGTRGTDIDFNDQNHTFMLEFTCVLPNGANGANGGR